MKPLDAVYVFVADNPNEEGICGTTLPVTGMTAMVTGREHIAEMLKNHARVVATAMGKQVRLVRYVRAETLWTTDEG